MTISPPWRCQTKILSSQRQRRQQTRSKWTAMGAPTMKTIMIMGRHLRHSSRLLNQRRFHQRKGSSHSISTKCDHWILVMVIVVFLFSPACTQSTWQTGTSPRWHCYMARQRSPASKPVTGSAVPGTKAAKRCLKPIGWPSWPVPARNARSSSWAVMSCTWPEFQMMLASVSSTTTIWWHCAASRCVSWWVPWRRQWRKQSKLLSNMLRSAARRGRIMTQSPDISVLRPREKCTSASAPTRFKHVHCF